MEGKKLVTRQKCTEELWLELIKAICKNSGKVLLKKCTEKLGIRYQIHEHLLKSCKDEVRKYERNFAKNNVRKNAQRIQELEKSVWKNGSCDQQRMHGKNRTKNYTKCM